MRARFPVCWNTTLACSENPFLEFTYQYRTILFLFENTNSCAHKMENCNKIMETIIDATCKCNQP
jgi:hypothetical protein